MAFQGLECGQQNLASSCPGIRYCERWGQQEGLWGTYSVGDGSRVGRKQLGNDRSQHAIGGSCDTLCGLLSSISAHLSWRFVRDAVN